MVKKTKNIKTESKEELENKFPAALVKAFIAVSEDNWDSDKLYNAYKKQVIKYLGKAKAEDSIEAGKLIVQLARLTLDKVNKKPRIINCKTHNSYSGARKPRTDCKDCWAMYEAKKKAKEKN